MVIEVAHLKANAVQHESISPKADLMSIVLESAEIIVKKQARTILRSIVTALEQSVKDHKALEKALRQCEATLRVQIATLTADIENLMRSLSEHSLSLIFSALWRSLSSATSHSSYQPQVVRA